MFARIARAATQLGPGAGLGLGALYCGASRPGLGAEEEERPRLPLVYFIVKHQDSLLGTVIMELRSLLALSQPSCPIGPCSADLVHPQVGYRPQDCRELPSTLHRRTRIWIQVSHQSVI